MRRWPRSSCTTSRASSAPSCRSDRRSVRAPRVIEPRIHSETFGAGTPIVLVHGWGSDLRHNWVATGWVEALSATRRGAAPARPGPRRSDKPRKQAAYGYRAMSRDVLRVMDALEIEKADFLGYSLGAFMGVCLLAD